VQGTWFGYRWDDCELCWFGYKWDPVSSVGLAIVGMPVSVGQFGYRCDSCELVALGYSWVTEVQCHA
jgi:hypothetical protein